MKTPPRQIELHALAHAQPGHSLAVLDLKGKPPSRATVAGILHLLNRESTLLILNAHRQTVIPPPSPVLWAAKEPYVVQGILRGFSNRDIAIDIGTTEQTVKNMCHDIYRKLHVKNRAQLILQTNSSDHFFVFNVGDDGSLVPLTR